MPLDKLLEHARHQLPETLPSLTSSLKARSRTGKLWSPPTSNGYKDNFDRANIEKENKVGLGVVIRNHERLVMASLSQLVPLPPSVIEVEALAARRAMELALELGFHNIIVEGDSEILIKVLQQQHRSLASFANDANDIFFLASHFSCFNFMHVRRAM